MSMLLERSTATHAVSRPLCPLPPAPRLMLDLHLTINGDPRIVVGPATVTDLLRQLGFDPRAVVVELNRAIVRRSEHGATSLADGDTVELVHFVGGG